MKILLLGTAYPWRGGIAHYTTLLAKYLSNRGHKVDIVTFRRQYPKLLFPGKSQEEIGEPVNVIKTETLIDSINPFNWIKTGLQLRRREYDTVVFKYWIPFFGPCFGTICHLVKFRKKSTIIALCDNIIPHERRIGDKLFTRFAFTAVDAYIVQSQKVENDLKMLVKKAKYKRIEHPIYEIFGEQIDKNYARNKLQLSDEKIILFFGYIRKYKGLDTLLDALKLVLQQIKVKLLVVGEFYEDEKSYLERAKKLDIMNSVIFVSHYVPNEQVATYFCAADCVVLPYRSATQSGIVQIAFNFDKPVIVTEVGGLTEVVRNNTTGFIVPPEDPAALAKAIVKFYNENCEQKFSEEIKKIRQNFSWDKMVDAIEQLTEEIKKEKGYHL